MFTTGGNNNRFYAGFKEKHLYPDTDGLPSCEIDFSRSDISFFLRGDTKKIYISFHYEGETEYVTCMSVNINSEMMTQFFITMFARGIKRTKMRIDISAMTLSTDAENIGVSEYEAKFDENVPKLFKQISFYKSNKDIIQDNIPEPNADLLDIEQIHSVQSRIHDVIDYSNAQLSRSLEETNSILSYVENQNYSTEEMGGILLSSLNEWLENTEKQYQKMDKDVSHLVAEMEAFNFDELYDTTNSLLSDLNNKLQSSSEDFKMFRSFSKLINKNLDSLDQKRTSLKNLPKLLKKLLKNKTVNKSNAMQTGLILLLAFMGVFIVIALLSILYKLGTSSKRNILG